MPSRGVSPQTYDLAREISAKVSELLELRSGHGTAIGAFVREKARARHLITLLQPDGRRRLALEQVEAMQRELDLTLGGIKTMAEREQETIAAHAEGLEQLRSLVATASERDPEGFSPGWFPKGVDVEIPAIFQDDLAELRDQADGLLGGT